MSRAKTLSTDYLTAELEVLCRQPSSTGQLPELRQMARIVANSLRRSGLHTRIIQTPGAPIVLGHLQGQRPETLILYHHYDVAHPGPWSQWSHPPFQMAEREQAIYARGVAHGKGALVAHLYAIKTLLHREGQLPCSVLLVAEGEGLYGSPHLERLIRRHVLNRPVIGCLTTAGERDKYGKPFCYVGSKGLLRVRLSADGAALALPSGLATSVSNPIWQLIWALNSIKGEDEDIRVNGFYDNVNGPDRKDRTILRTIALDEEGRLSAWQIDDFLFGMRGSALVRSEVTLPTCNLSSFTVEPPNMVVSIPTRASACLDFHLVPDQDPDDIVHLLVQHLKDRSPSTIEIERLPGGYRAVRVDHQHPFVQQLLHTAERVYGQSLTVLPFGPFALPLQLVSSQLGIPVAVVGLARHNSAMYGPNEHLPVDDLMQHSQMLIDLMYQYGQQKPEGRLSEVEVAQQESETGC
ncbi:MAG: M20/M25/M40 family metallo-hydrolase [Chloroflexaceae bacterium]|nr:M20/M25/M40 family metallo-hydrolase [Chloroflexaceae bacterium]